MLKLSSTIVQRKIASLRDVEEALARQVLYGGDLVTNLLEKAEAVDESALCALLAESLELPAAPSGELPRVAPDVLKLVPGDVALRHGLFPIEETANRLAVAVSDKLSQQVEQDLAFALGVELEQRAAPLVRIRQAISRDYGLPLDRRSQRAIARLEGKPDPSPSIAPKPLLDAPELASLPRPPTFPPIGLPAAAGSTPIHAPAAPRAETVAPSVHDAVTAPAPPVEAPRVADSGGSTVSKPSTPAPTKPERRATPPRSPGGPTAPPRRSSQVMPAPNLAAWGAEQKRPSRDRRRSRHRGPYTAADAEKDLLAAQDRDEILAAFFDFAAQYFEYSALFAVQGDLAEGRDAQGPGADRTAITGIGVPLDLPSALATARDERRFALAPLGATGIDARLAGDLKRPIGKKVLVLPVVVRQRSVLVLYGDDGDADVELSDVGDVIAFAPLVAAALESVILKRKAAARRAAGETDARTLAGANLGVRERPVSRLPPAEERAEALVQALEQGYRPEQPRKTSKGPPPKPARKETPLPPKGTGNEQQTPPASPSARRSETAEAEPRRLAPTKPELPTPPGQPSKTRSKRPPTPPQGTPKQAWTPPPEGGLPVFELTRRSKPTSVAPDDTDVPEDGWDVASEPQLPEPPTQPKAPAETAGSVDDSPDISIGVEDLDPDLAIEVGRDSELLGSRSVSVAPQVPPAKRPSSEELKLPKVIVDVGADCKKLVDDLIAGDDTAVKKLKHLGAPAVAALLARFPGPISGDPNRPGHRARASEYGPILKALAAVGSSAMPFVLVRTNDADPSIRAWATRLLGEYSSVDAAQAIARRITDKDPQVRRAAHDAGSVIQDNLDARVALRDSACAIVERRDQPQENRLYALEALAHWKDPRSVPRLVPLLAESSEIVPSAAWALKMITRHDAGVDVRAWDAWWERNANRHRIEWLIDALMADNPELRRDAGEELKTLTKEYFGYYDDLPKAERAQAQKRYRQWWEASGKARFSV